MGSIEQNGKEEGKVDGIYPVWLCVALEIRVEGYPRWQKSG